MSTILLRRGSTAPITAFAAVGEPGLVTDPARPQLIAQIAAPPAPPVVLADPVYIAELEARIRLLEQALRELQFTAWTGMPTYPIPP